MKKKSASRSAFFNPRVLIGFVLCLIGLLLAVVGWSKSATDSLGNPVLKTGMSASTATAQAPWIELAPTGGPPERRELLVAVYDAATNRMIIHGGLFHTGGDIVFADAWVLSNADGTEGTTPTWTELLPANPLQRWVHAAVYDSFSNRMVVFGGAQSRYGPDFNDVWVLTNANGMGGDPEGCNSRLREAHLSLGLTPQLCTMQRTIE